MNKKKQQYKKPVAIGCAAAVAVCIVGGIWMYIDSRPESPEKPAETRDPADTTQYVYTADGYHRPSFYDADYDTDIFTYKPWLDKIRYITFKNGGYSVMITDGSHSDYGEPVAMFAEYFDALMNGDADRLNSFYSDSYFESNPRYEGFTMQKIYDITVELIASADKKNDDGSDVIEYVYKLSYKILENDGTFRSDIESDANRSQFYTVTDDGASVKITAVSYSYTA